MWLFHRSKPLCLNINSCSIYITNKHLTQLIPVSSSNSLALNKYGSIPRVVAFLQKDLAIRNILHVLRYFAVKVSD